MVKRILNFGLLGGLWFLLVFVSAAQTEIDLDELSAQEEFRWGVAAYHNGFYNKAIQSLEKSLSLKQDNPLVKSWLGRGYYKSGYEDPAVQAWSDLVESGDASSALKTLRDMVVDRNGLLNELRLRDSWAPLAEFIPQDDSLAPLFYRPASVVPSRKGDGSFYIVSYVNSEVVRINPNGKIIERFDGGLNGFDHPYDILPLDDGRLLISEYSGDKIAVCSSGGIKQASFGVSDVPSERLLGPQFMTRGEPGYFFVSDWGNKRIVKYDLEGQFIMSFGKAAGDFPGLKGPTGLVFRDGILYVADTLASCLYLFDINGNFLETLGKGRVNSPEGLFFQDDENLLIADHDSVKNLNIRNLNISSIKGLDAGSGKILDICLDDNGNLVTSDFNANKVSVYTEVSSLYSGVFVRIDRINAIDFPDIHVDFTVEDRFGNPLVGLDKSNLILFDGAYPINDYKLSYSGYLSDELELAFLVDSSRSMIGQYSYLENAVRQVLFQLEEKDRSSLFVAGDSPVRLYGGNDSKALYGSLPQILDTFSDKNDLSSGLRLAATELVTARSRKAVILFSDGMPNEEAFDSYGLLETAQYLQNNGIALHLVYMNNMSRNEELEYLVKSTGGQLWGLFQPAGLNGLIESIRKQNTGRYTVSYKSPAFSDFGRAYIPTALEVIYIKKSGRDELGYFAPLEF